MTILNVTQYLNSNGQLGSSPNILGILCNNIYSEVITAGFITANRITPYNVTANDMVMVKYSGGITFFSVSIDSAGVITLTDEETIIPGNLVVNGSITSTTGDITSGSGGNAGKFISYPATASRGTFEFVGANNTGDTATILTNAAMGQATTLTLPDPGATTANVILSKSAGTQAISSGNLAVSAGDLSAGSSGAAGTVRSYPLTSARGYLEVKAVANAADYATIISNFSCGQATTWTLPDPGAASANILVYAGALSPGDLLKASGTGGKMVSAGAAGTSANKAASDDSKATVASVVTTPTPGVGAVATFTATNGTIGYVTGALRCQNQDYAGGNANFTITDANITTAHKVTAWFSDQTNASSVYTSKSGTGNFSMKTSADPGASTIQYIAILAQ